MWPLCHCLWTEENSTHFTFAFISWHFASCFVALTLILVQSRYTRPSFVFLYLCRKGSSGLILWLCAGRVHQALGHHTQAVQYLQQGLTIAEQLRRREDEAKIRHRLGLALWGSGNLEECQKQMNTAADLFETIRRESQCSSEYKLSLFDLQTACYQALQVITDFV